MLHTAHFADALSCHNTFSARAEAMQGLRT